MLTVPLCCLFALSLTHKALQSHQCPNQLSTVFAERFSENPLSCPVRLGTCHTLGISHLKKDPCNCFITKPDREVGSTVTHFS